MPTILTHGIAGLAAGGTLPRPLRVWRNLSLAAACAVVPDLDAIGLRLGVPYAHWLGHRGFLHSLVFALVLALLAYALANRSAAGWWERIGLLGVFFLAAASHGLLDAATNGGLGVALFAPFSTERFFLPWRAIVVAPLAPRYLVGDWGLRVFASEALSVWLPATVLVAGTRGFRRWRDARGRGRDPLGRSSNETPLSGG